MYGHFDILMAHYIQVKTCCTLQHRAKIVLWLRTARTKNPDTPKTHLSASDFPKYHSDTSRHRPNIPQTSPGHMKCQQTTADNNKISFMPPQAQKNGWVFAISFLFYCLSERHRKLHWHLVNGHPVFRFSFVHCFLLLLIFLLSDLLICFSLRSEGVCTKVDTGTGQPIQIFKRRYKKEHKVGIFRYKIQEGAQSR